MTPEGKVKAAVKKLLKAYDAYYHMPVQNGMGAPALDFHVCHKGRYLGIETKGPNGKPTERQLLTMQEIDRAGGAAMVVKSETDLQRLQFWLECDRLNNDDRRD